MELHGVPSYTEPAEILQKVHDALAAAATAATAASAAATEEEDEEEDADEDASAAGAGAPHRGSASLPPAHRRVSDLHLQVCELVLSVLYLATHLTTILYLIPLTRRCAGSSPPYLAFHLSSI